MNTNGSAVPTTNSAGPLSGLVSGLGGTTGQATSDVGGTGGHLLSNVANTVGNTLKGAGNKTSSTGGPIGSATGGILGGTGSAIGTTGNAAGGLTSKVANAVGGAVNALSGNAPLPQGQNFAQNPFATTQAPLGSTHHMGTSSHHMGTSSHLPHGSHLSEVAREVHVAPTVVVEKVEKPTIIKETILPQEKIEVQPIIHREREQLEVHEVVQPLHERDIAATHVRHATLPAEVRKEVRESDTAFQTSYRQAATRHIPEVHTEAVRREFVNRAPIVEEHVHKKIVEEVQPVLYRETVTPVIIEETKPIYEKIVEAPRIVEEIKPMVDLGTRYTELPTAQMSNLSISGQNYQTGGLPYATGQNFQAGGFPYATGQNFGGLPFANQQLQRDTVVQETFVEPARATHLPGTSSFGTSNLPNKETTITQETYVEPARATSHPHTHSKRIV